MQKPRLTDDDMIRDVHGFVVASLKRLHDQQLAVENFDLAFSWYCFGAILKISERNVLEGEHYRYDAVLRGVLEKTELIDDLDSMVKKVRTGPPKDFTKFLNTAFRAFGAYQQRPAEEFELGLRDELQARQEVAVKLEEFDQILQDEALRLSKPCMFLQQSDVSDATCGIWGGNGVVPAPSRLWRHVCSVNCDWFGTVGIPLRGWLSVYVSDKSSAVRAFCDEHRTFTPTQSDIRLTGVPRLSMPPMQAICHFGGSNVDEWLRKRGLDRRDYDAFDLPELDENYTKNWQKTCPLYGDEADIVLGGWHLQWPDGKRYDKRPGTLCLTTFRDAEPWIEVWCESSGKLKCFARVT